MKGKGFLSGVVCGALLVGGIPAAFAAAGTKTISATYGDIKVYINEVPITPKDANGKTVEPFIADGTTYLPVRAAAEALGHEVVWDGATKSVYIGTQPDRLSAQSEQNAAASASVLTVPNNGDKRFVPVAGDRILCDDGSVYEIVKGPDLNSGSSFTASGKWHPSEELPEPTCDWSVYPDLLLPDVLGNRWNDEYGDDLHILNLHEMLRVQYTLYNHILPETQRYYFTDHPGMIDSLVKLGKSTDIKDLVGQVRFGYLYYDTQQGFYPWDENEVVKQVKNTPAKMFCVEVWDVYHDGYYTRTEYKLQTRQRESSG
jgi:hypothetical protein